MDTAFLSLRCLEKLSVFLFGGQMKLTVYYSYKFSSFIIFFLTWSLTECLGDFFFLYFHDIFVLSELSETFGLTRSRNGTYGWNWDRRHLACIPDNLLPFFNFSLAFC